MKRVLIGLLVFISFIDVSAKDYPAMELIPVNEKASVSTKLFFYHNFYYDANHEQASYLDGNSIIFDEVKNLDNKDRDVSVTIGFFDSEKRNIGVYYYCSRHDKTGPSNNISLSQSKSKPMVININSDMLYKDNSVGDVQYISVMSDNPNCNSGSNYDFVGRKAGYIEFEDKAAYDYTYVRYCFYVLILIMVILVVKYIFDMTINKDGRITDIIFGVPPRDKRTNDEIKSDYFKRREADNKKNKKVEKKKEIKNISQEDGKTDLHNMYK